MEFQTCEDIVNIEISFQRDIVKLLSALVAMIGGQSAVTNLNLENPPNVNS